MLPTRSFPLTRLRRFRKHAWSRDLVQENVITANDLIYPLFVREPDMDPNVKTLPDINRLTIEELLKKIEESLNVGIRTFALFPVVSPSLKNDGATESLNDSNLICRAIQSVKRTFKNDIGLIVDVALDPYTSHGHDGIVDMDNYVLNDSTVDILKGQAVTLAEAGADCVAPSDMMDGRISAIRHALDANNLHDISIISYAAKYSSTFYGPFRDAVSSNPSLGRFGKAGYQMSSSNADEALYEVQQDIEEGADAVIIKPALPYLDILYRITENFKVPTFAYHVSGEYIQLKLAAKNGAFLYEDALLESMICMKRAGARAILTYAALEVATLLKS